MLKSMQNIFLGEEVGAGGFASNWYAQRFSDGAVWCDLTEHLHWVEPGLHILQAKLVVDFSNTDALNLNESSVSLCGDLLPFAKVSLAQAFPP